MRADAMPDASDCLRAGCNRHDVEAKKRPPFAAGVKTGTAIRRRELLLDRPGEAVDLGKAEDFRDQRQNQ
jgi:hypothetical protein